MARHISSNTGFNMGHSAAAPGADKGNPNLLPKRIASAIGVLWVLLAIIVTPALPAWATLAQDAQSIDRDQANMHATAGHNITATGYTEHLLTLPSGTFVREYIGPDGLVFAITWQGPTLPDLRSTLGPAFNQYRTNNAIRHANPTQLSMGKTVIISGGHPRAFSGRAYLPEAIPAGVDVNGLQ